MKIEKIDSLPKQKELEKYTTVRIVEKHAPSNMVVHEMNFDFNGEYWVDDFDEPRVRWDTDNLLNKIGSFIYKMEDSSYPYQVKILGFVDESRQKWIKNHLIAREKHMERVNRFKACKTRAPARKRTNRGIAQLQNAYKKML